MASLGRRQETDWPAEQGVDNGVCRVGITERWCLLRGRVWGTVALTEEA